MIKRIKMLEFSLR